MDYELDYVATLEDLQIASTSDVLFEQYDEEELSVAANDDAYENLYPSLN